MPIRIPISCPHCSRVHGVSPAAINTTAICDCGHSFIVRRESNVSVNVAGHNNTVRIGVVGNRFEVATPHAAQDVIPHRQAARYDLRQLEYFCAETGKPFSSMFRREAEGEPYRFWRNEYGSGSLYRTAYSHAETVGLAVDQEPEEENYPASEFDFKAWSCQWCGNDGHLICSCGAKFCRSRARRIADGWVAYCEICGEERLFNRYLESVHGMSAKFSRPDPELRQHGPSRDHAITHEAPQELEVLPRLANLVRKALK